MVRLFSHCGRRVFAWLRETRRQQMACAFAARGGRIDSCGIRRWAGAGGANSGERRKARRCRTGVLSGRRCARARVSGKNLMFSRTYKAAVTLPPLLWVTVFLLMPYLLMFCYSFWSVSASQTIVHAWNLDNYRQLLRVEVYWQTLLRSMWIAARVTIFSLLLGYPLAYFLSFYAGGKKELLYQLVIIPLWVSYLVRAYAWKTILGSEGVLNTLLQYVHLTKHPLEFLLYSPFAVVLTLTHIYTPFTFLPIYAALEHIPRNLVEASHDLGATPAQTFWKVILPLSIPGVVAGATFAFVLSLGDFLDR